MVRGEKERKRRGELPKAGGSRRSIGLTAKAVDALRGHRERQQAEGFPVAGDTLVFTNSSCATPAASPWSWRVGAVCTWTPTSAISLSRKISSRELQGICLADQSAWAEERLRRANTSAHALILATLASLDVDAYLRAGALTVTI